jgi:hypothetical protein
MNECEYKQDRMNWKTVILTMRLLKAMLAQELSAPKTRYFMPSLPWEQKKRIS